MHSGSAAADGPERERHPVAGGGLGGGIDLGDFAADHETNETSFVDVADGVRADALTIAQDGDAVGEGEDFLEAVGNINDADAVFAEVADDGEEEALLLLGEGRGGLVHDHDAGTGAEGAGDFHELLLGHGEGAHFGFGGNLGAEAGEPLLGSGAAGGPIDPRAGGRGFEAEREIFGDGEVGEQGRLLVNTGDAERARGRRREVGDALAGEGEGAAVGLMRAGDDLNERAFARAVLAEQGVDLARLKIEIHAAKRTHAAVVFYELAECEERG